MKEEFRKYALESPGGIVQYRYKDEVFNPSSRYLKSLEYKYNIRGESDRFFANNAYGKRTYIDDADPKQMYVCPVCKYPMIQKRGRIMTHHFAHKSKVTCDPWYSGKMSAWHKEMQDLFPHHCQEIIVRDDEHGEYHIADVVFKKNSKYYVVEFQHSAISYDEILIRPCLHA